jgi:hypothetical protein
LTQACRLVGNREKRGKQVQEEKSMVRKTKDDVTVNIPINREDDVNAMTL